jgi:surface protein
MFSDCELLSSLPDISKWNTQNVTNLNRMFSNCISLSSLPDIAKWNIQNVTEKSDMFIGCNENIIILQFNEI